MPILRSFSEINIFEDSAYIRRNKGGDTKFRAAWVYYLIIPLPKIKMYGCKLNCIGIR